MAAKWLESDGPSGHARRHRRRISGGLSDDANWITGQTLVADGGASLMSAKVPQAFQQP